MLDRSRAVRSWPVNSADNLIDFTITGHDHKIEPMILVHKISAKKRTITIIDGKALVHHQPFVVIVVV